MKKSFCSGNIRIHEELKAVLETTTKVIQDG
jgi:hypothetical protein